jgi:hypothetical protein
VGYVGARSEEEVVKPARTNAPEVWPQYCFLVIALRRLPLPSAALSIACQGLGTAGGNGGRLARRVFVFAPG